MNHVRLVPTPGEGFVAVSGASLSLVPQLPCLGRLGAVARQSVASERNLEDTQKTHES